tara:strand:+ start:478 stop:672 length:195 start_codon:yes stop_codon:yes gene_type:complete
MRVENIDYNIVWKAFTPGTSFFIPCLTPKSAKKEIRPTLKRLEIEVVMKVVIEEGVRGLRVWRV